MKGLAGGRLCGRNHDAGAVGCRWRRSQRDRVRPGLARRVQLDGRGQRTRSARGDAHHAASRSLARGSRHPRGRRGHAQAGRCAARARGGPRGGARPPTMRRPRPRGGRAMRRDPRGACDRRGTRTAPRWLATAVARARESGGAVRLVLGRNDRDREGARRRRTQPRVRAGAGRAHGGGPTLSRRASAPTASTG